MQQRMLAKRNTTAARKTYKETLLEGEVRGQGQVGGKHTPVVLAFERLVQKDCAFRVSLDYSEPSRLAPPYNKNLFQKQNRVEMAQQLRVLAAIPENPSSIHTSGNS
jgi:hypothetical protein